MEQQMFAILIPGQPPITTFQISNNVLVYDLYNPGQISSITFFKMMDIPQDLSGVLYYSMYPFQDLQFIGAIANHFPTDIFNTGFCLNPEINQQQMIKLVIKLESLEQIKSLVMINNQQNIQKEYGKKVAQNLYNFMVSFHKEGIIQNGDYLVLPTNCLELWFKKFEEKFTKDQNFILKTSY